MPPVKKKKMHCWKNPANVYSDFQIQVCLVALLCLTAAANLPFDRAAATSCNVSSVH